MRLLNNYFSAYLR